MGASITLDGRLTADPKLEYTKSKMAICRLRVACDVGRKDDPALFMSCTTWGKTAEFIAQYGRKGARVSVYGEPQSDDWTDKEEKKHTKVRTNVDRLTLHDWPDDDKPDKPKPRAIEEPVPDESDIPF